MLALVNQANYLRPGQCFPCHSGTGCFSDPGHQTAAKARRCSCVSAVTFRKGGFFPIFWPWLSSSYGVTSNKVGAATCAHPHPSHSFFLQDRIWAEKMVLWCCWWGGETEAGSQGCSVPIGSQAACAAPSLVTAGACCMTPPTPPPDAHTPLPALFWGIWVKVDGKGAEALMPCRGMWWKIAPTLSQGSVLSPLPDLAPTLAPGGL